MNPDELTGETTSPRGQGRQLLTVDLPVEYC
jgi:hypothetical protein